MKTLSGEDRIHELLSDVARWRLLELFFEAPERQWRKNVEDIARESHDPQLKSIAELALRDASPELYHSIFGPGGPAGPRAVTYDRSIQPGQTLADLAAFYHAFGYAPQTSEPLDHIAVELGFLGYLRLKQAYAAACGAAQSEALVGDAAQRFTSVFLSRVARPLARRLAPCEIPYLTQAAALLLEYVNNECGVETAETDEGGCSPLESDSFNCSCPMMESPSSAL